MNYRIGVDGGGTNTRAVLIDENADVVGRGEAGTSNHYSVGPDRAVENIRRAIDAALSGAQVLEREVTGWGLGLAGACTQVEQSTLFSRLELVAGTARVVVDEDAAAAWSGAFAGEAGVICIAGTGANSFGVAPDGQRARADGLGPLLGDRGSGYRIGEAALRSICSADDGSGPGTTLLRPVLDTFECATVDELVQVVYKPEFKRDRVASVVPLVFEAAVAGDAVAVGLLKDAGQALAETTLTVLRKLGVARVAPVGGVLSQASPVREHYESVLRAALPDISIELPIYDAAIGAALLLS